MVALLNPEQHWVCPNCTATDVTHEVLPHTRFHNCPGLKGMLAPMVHEGVHCKVVAHEREDYVGAEMLTYDGDARPIMSVETVRNDGNDLAVFAPCAQGKVER